MNFPVPGCCPFPPPFAEAMMPPPPPFQAFCGEEEFKQYTVEMRLVELRDGQDEKLVAEPTLMVTENRPAQVSAGVSHASLWKKGVPANDMGHEGHQISVVVSSTKPGHVCLSCWVWTSELDHNVAGHACLRESRSNTACHVKLGETAKVSCDRVCGGEKVSCRLEVTVKECQRKQKQKSVACPCPAPAWCGVHPAGCLPRVQVGDQMAPFEGCKMAGEAVQAAWTAPAPRPAGEGRPAAMEFTSVEHPATECGKMGDLLGPGHQLRVCSEGVCMTCGQMEVKLAGAKPVKVSVQEDRVRVEGEKLEALADRVRTDSEKYLILEGNVRVLSSTEKIEVESGWVKMKLD